MLDFLDPPLCAHAYARGDPPEVTRCQDNEPDEQRNRPYSAQACRPWGARPRGQNRDMPREMDHEAAERIADAAERDPHSPTATSGFDERAAAAADRAAEDQDDYWDDDE